MENKIHQKPEDLDFNANTMAQRLLRRYAIKPGLISRTKIDSLISKHTYSYSPFLRRLQRWTKMTPNPQVFRAYTGYVYSKPAYAKTLQHNENAMHSFSEYAAITADSLRSVQASPAIGQVVAGMSHGKSQSGGLHERHVEPYKKHRIVPALATSERFTSEGFTSQRRSGGSGTIKTVPYTNAHKSVGINAIPNNLAAKIMKNQGSAVKVAKSPMTDSAGGLPHRKFELNHGNMAPAQKRPVAGSNSAQSSHDANHSSNNEGRDTTTGYSHHLIQLETPANTVAAIPSNSVQTSRNTNHTSIADSHIETGTKRHANLSKSPANFAKTKSRTQAHPQIISAKPTQPHVLQTHADSGFGSEFVSSNLHSVKHNSKFSRNISAINIGDAPVLNKAADHKPPASNMSMSSGQGDTQVTNTKGTNATVTSTIVTNIGPEIRSRPLLSHRVSLINANAAAKKATDREGTANGDVTKVQRRSYGGQSSPPSPQVLPTKSAIIAAKTTLAKSQPATVDAVDYTHVHPRKSHSGDKNIFFDAVPQNLAEKVETKSIIQRQNNPTVLLSRAIFQRNSKLAKNTLSLRSNKVSDTSPQYAVAYKDVADSRPGQLKRSDVSDGGRYVKMSQNSALPVSGATLEIRPQRVAKNSFTLSRQAEDDFGASPPGSTLMADKDIVPASYKPQGTLKVQGKGYESFAGMAQNSSVTVLARVAKIVALNRISTNVSQPHSPAFGVPWEGGPVLPSMPSYMPRQSHKPASVSHNIMKSALNAKALPVISPFSAQPGREINTRHNAPQNAQGTPLLRLNVTSNLGAQSVQTHNSYGTQSGAHRLQTANDSASGVTGTPSQVSAGQSTAATAPTTDTSATATQIMQLEQHELEYLAQQIYEIIEDRLELERESMGLM